MNRIIVLEDPFDPYDLPPGYYTAYSDTPAYPTLWSMVNVGMAHDEGSRYLEGGVVQIMASYEMPPLERNPEDDDYEEAMVIIPHSSFTKVINDYANWRQMWWREVIQNSVDAGATKVDCRVQEQEDGTWLVSCQDDGSGMSYDTLMNAFFTVGGTDKPRYARGGFGEAKKLIALAWISYSVHTNEILVSGTGAEFPKLKVYRNVDIMKGTKVEVVMPADKHTTEAAAIEYISRCQLPGIRFFVNGNPVKANLRRGQKKKDLPRSAELFYNKNVEGIHALLVRSDGLYMFERELSSDFKGIIVVEVHPKPEDQGGPTVEQIFVSNRMSLQWGELAEEVDRVYTQADFDLRQALRDPDALFRKRYEGRGFFSTETARNREAMVREAAGPLPEIEDGGGLEMTGDMLNSLSEQFRKFEAQSTEEAAGDATRLVGVLSAEEAEIMLGMAFKGESHLESSIQQMVWQPDFININDETTREGFKLDRKFDPAYMTGPVYALARLWAAFVRFVLIKQGSDATWGVGFVFSTEVQGMFYQDDAGERWICLNPINLSTGKLMSIREPADVRLIFEVAMHECAHLVGGTYHGDAFVRALDSLVIEMLQHWNEAKRIAKMIKVRGVVKKMAKSKTPEQTELVVTPMGEKLAHFSVIDGASIDAFQKDLGLDGRDLEFYLEDEALEDRWLSRSENWDRFQSGLTFATKMSYPWVRRELLAANERPSGEIAEAAYVMPVRITAMHDGRLFVEPDRKSDRWWFQQYFRELSDASLRVPVTGSAEFTDMMLEKWFFENRELTNWPYVEQPRSPGQFVATLFEHGSVVIPLDRWEYNNTLTQWAERTPSSVRKRDHTFRINVWRNNNSGRYHLHPRDSEDYDFYRERFDTGEKFDLVLDKGRESKQLEEHLDAFNEEQLIEDIPTMTYIPIDLFDRWVYNHEFQLRRDDWHPYKTDDTLLMADNTVTVLAQNLGPNIMAFKFPSPGVQGVAIARRYTSVGVSDLIWFMLADEMSKLLAALDFKGMDHDELDLLERFWKACSPGTMTVRMLSSIFIQGIDPQFKRADLEPYASCPVWLYFNEDILTIKPVLASHQRWLRMNMFRPGGESKEALAVISDTQRAETIARQILQSTYNCGTTPSGLRIAEDHYDKLVDEGKPVLAAILTTDLIELIQES